MEIASPSLTRCRRCGGLFPPGWTAAACPGCLVRISVDGPESAPALLGDYELLDEIARGGMGIVYRARQRRLNRTVAVKILAAGDFASAEAQRRFRVEAESAARLQHPGIVTIHDVGETDGLPWLSMDLINGPNLAMLVREQPLPGREAAEYVRAIAEAVQHAHDHGVLHRDLKPSNVLLDPETGPRVTDFGIARCVDAGERTRTGEVLGSPGYTAPEQALEGRADARTDVYGLGALLYHLLTARPPFQGPTLEAILLQLRESDPIAPRRLNPSVPRDLETICLRCLRKEPAQRYATAREVADELGRFQRGEPIVARPLGPAGTAWRWCRRHPTTATLLATVLLLLAALAAGALWSSHEHAAGERRATLLATARTLRTAGVAGTRTQGLALLREAWDIAPSAEIRDEAIAFLALPEASFSATLATDHPDARPPDPATSSDGRVTAAVRDGAIVIGESSTGRETARIEGWPVVQILRLDDSGRRIAIAAPKSGEVHVLEVSSGRLLCTLKHPHPIRCADWSGDLMATGCDDRFIYIWDASKGVLRHRFSGHDSEPESVRFRHRGQELASVGQDQQLFLWHAARGSEWLAAQGGGNRRGPAWWSADDARFFCRRADDAGVDVFRVSWPGMLRVLSPPQDEPHSENVRTLGLSRDGAWIAAVDENECRVWDTITGRIVESIPKQGGEWLSARFSPDDSRLWLCGWNSGLRWHAVSREPDGTTRLGPQQRVKLTEGSLLAALSADGTALATLHVSLKRVFVLWPATGQNLQLKHPSPMAAAFSPDSRLLVTTGYAHPSARVWSLPEGRLLREIATPGAVPHLEFSSDGRSLGLRGTEGCVRVNTATWQPESGGVRTESLPGLVWSGDGQFAACSHRNAIRLLDGRSLDDLAHLTAPPASGPVARASMAFTDDGRRLIAHTAIGSLLVWDIAALRTELRALGMEW